MSKGWSRAIRWSIALSIGLFMLSCGATWWQAAIGWNVVWLGTLPLQQTTAGAHSEEER